MSFILLLVSDALGKSPGADTIFKDEKTAHGVVERIAVNLPRKNAEDRASGNLSNMDVSSSSKRPSNDLFAAASWTGLLKRPAGNDVHSLQRPTDGKQQLLDKVHGRHAPGCGPKCFCFKCQDEWLAPKKGKAKPVTNGLFQDDKISGPVRVPGGSGIGISQFCFDVHTPLFQLMLNDYFIRFSNLIVRMKRWPKTW